LDALFTSFKNIESYYNPYRATANMIPGIFVTSPIFLFSLHGFFILFKRNRKEFYLLITCILISTLIAGLHVTTLVRHFYTINMLLFLPFVYSIDAILKMKYGIRKRVFLTLLILAIVISFIRVSFSTFTYWGRDFNNFFLYRKEIRLFIIVNIPIFIILTVFMKRRKIL